jgi:spore coat polysaccharide biosynthesis protein SpsF
VITAIVQARINSTRLPAKVLLDLAGKSVMTHVIERLRRALKVDKIVVATTTASRDDAVADLSERLGVVCYRGSELDVLNRYYRAAVQAGADTVVRITSDCPLIDPEVVDQAIDLFNAGAGTLDYVGNEGYPRGFDVEVMSFSALERAWREDPDAVTREHVTPFIIRRPALFPAAALQCPKPVRPYRLTLDTLEDYHLIFKIARAFDGAPPGWQGIVDLLDEHPDWQKINAHVKQVRLPVTEQENNIAS